MISDNACARAINIFSLIPFFPKEDGPRAELLQALSELCESDEVLLWLAKAAANEWGTWQSFASLRAIYRRRYQERPMEQEYYTHPDLGRVRVSPPLAQADRAKLEAPNTLPQIEGEVQRLSPAEVADCLNESIAPLLESQAPIVPRRSDRLEALRIAAMLGAHHELAERIAKRILVLGSDAEDRALIAEAEKQIAQAKPTLTAEEKQRRIDEIESNLRSRESIQ